MKLSYSGYFCVYVPLFTITYKIYYFSLAWKQFKNSF